MSTRRSPTLKALTSRLALRNGFDERALDGAYQLTLDDPQILLLDTDGDDRTVTLPDRGGLLGENGYFFLIFAAGDGGDTLTVTDGTLSVALEDGETGLFFVAPSAAGWAGAKISEQAAAAAAFAGRLDALELLEPSIAREIDDPGHDAAIPVDASGTVAFTIADAAETNTLADPEFVGQRLVLTVASRAGTGTRAVTAASVVSGSDDVMTFDAVRETLVLEAVAVGSDPKWQVVANVGSVALSGS